MTSARRNNRKAGFRGNRHDAPTERAHVIYGSIPLQCGLYTCLPPRTCARGYQGLWLFSPPCRPFHRLASASSSKPRLETILEPTHSGRLYLTAHNYGICCALVRFAVKRGIRSFGTPFGCTATPRQHRWCLLTSTFWHIRKHCFPMRTSNVKNG